MTKTAARGPKPRRAAAVAFLTLALSGTEARSESARVILAAPAAPDEVVAEVATRVRAELVAAAFEVVLVTLAPGANPREQLEASSLEPRPIATLAIVRLDDRPAVDIWVYDRLTDKTLVKRLDLGKRADAELTSALAIHAVELLRASLLETRTRSQAVAGAGKPPPIPREVGDWVAHAVEPPRTFFEGGTLAIAGALLHSFAGIGPAFAPAVRIAIGAPSGLAGRVSVVGPAFGARLRAPKGTAFVRQELAMLEVVYAPSRAWLAPLASIGAGGYHLYTSGEPSDPRNHGFDDHVWAALVDAGIGLAARLGGGAAISIDLHAFVTEPAAKVAIGDGAEDARIGPTGRPSFVASFGLQSSF
ncbi:MAG TPA: hypothetical protein VK550_26685 [Polyangiaceae bacterium]|nr:hypothetical protein [Polyangiaceae bacterium]